MIGLLFILLSIFFIYVYVSILKNSNKEDSDILNVKIVDLPICGWNLLHVLFYFSLCFIFQLKTISGHFFIFSLGIAWFFLEKRLFSKYNKNFMEKNKKNYVYSSISHPRYDDILFNFLGVLLHFLYQH